MKFSTDNELILMNQRNLSKFDKFQSRNSSNINFPHEFDPYTHIIKFDLKSQDKVLNVFIPNLPNGLFYSFNQEKIKISGIIKPFNEQMFENFEISNREQLKYTGSNYDQNGRLINDNYLFKIEIYVHYKTEINDSLKTLKINKSPFKIKTIKESFKPLYKNFDRVNNEIIFYNQENDILIKSHNGIPFENEMKEVYYNKHIINFKNSEKIIKNFDISNFDFDILNISNFEISNFETFKNLKNSNFETSNISEIIDSKYKIFFNSWFKENGWLTNEELIKLYEENSNGIHCRRHPNIKMIDLEKIYNEKCGKIICSLRNNENDHYIIKKTFLLPIIKDFNIDTKIFLKDYETFENSNFDDLKQLENFDDLEKYLNSQNYLNSRDSFKTR